MKRASAWTVCLAAGLLAFPEVSRAQVSMRAAVNDTVRIRNPGGREWTGTVSALRRDSIAIRSGIAGDPVWIPLSSDLAFDVARGERTYALRGLGIGMGVGALAGIALGLSTANDACTSAGGVSNGRTLCVAATRRVWTELGVLLLAPTGAIIGAIVGASITSPRWERIAANDLAISVIPRGSSTRFGISLSVP